MTFTRWSWLAAFLTCAQAVAGVASDQLSADQKTQLNNSAQILMTEDKPDSPWPAVLIYRFINATPEESAAVFSDYELRASFVPKMLESRISRVINPATKEVDYTIDVPVLADENYTVENHVSRYDNGHSYRFDWRLLRATSVTSSLGNVRLEPYFNEYTKQAGTLVAYYNFVTPGSLLAGLPFIKSQAIRGVSDTVKAIARQIEKEKMHDPELMQVQIKTLRAAVGQ